MEATHVGKAASKYGKLAVLLALAFTSFTRTRADHVLDEHLLVRKIFVSMQNYLLLRTTIV